MWPVEGINLGCVGHHLWHNSVSNQHVVHLKLKVICLLYLNKAGEKRVVYMISKAVLLFWIYPQDKEAFLLYVWVSQACGTSTWPVQTDHSAEGWKAGVVPPASRAVAGLPGVAPVPQLLEQHH